MLRSVFLIGLVSLPIQWLLLPWVPWGVWVLHLCFFSILTCSILWVAGRLAGHPNPQLFTGFALGAVLGKLVVCLFFVWAVVKVFEPVSRHFLWLFFYFYVSFTIMEIVHLVRIIHRDAERRPGAVTQQDQGT